MHRIELPRARAEPAALVTMGAARFTVLTPTLLRLEYDPAQRFEDRPTLFALHRRLPVPTFTQERSGDALVLRTDRLTLRYRDTGEPFRDANLSIELTPASAASQATPVRWQPSRSPRENLGGTLRTLDECNAAVAPPLGLLSRAGWSVVNDSGAAVLTADWVEARAGDTAATDWYFFGCGRDYAQAFRDLVAVSGRPPLPPRFALGSWYSRYWPYTADEYREIADEYRARGFPLDVLVLDMDWHEAGWTGYTWNRELIPDPPGLLQALHERSLQVALNLHPADGVGPHEADYARFARAVGRDPGADEVVPFDVTDPTYMRAYFEVLHHPLEAQGVDFWWIDWQQQRACAVPGLDALHWLNHLHACDHVRTGGRRRSLILSRWAGWGSHRYPIQFSGDTHASWSVLRYQVGFTATSGNAGACYWSHDLGGHFGDGRTDPELFVRWVQLGVFSATLRVHSTRSRRNDRRPWLDGPPFDEAVRQAYDLRYRLLPYLYTAARTHHDTGLPLQRPTYLAYPEQDEAYAAPGQFLLGDNLLVAPVTEPGRGPERLAEVSVWIPPGSWYDLLTGEEYAGPAPVTIEVPLHRVVALVRAGVPVPLAPPGCQQVAHIDRALHVRVYPGPAGRSLLYEDDGQTTAYRDGLCAWTPLTHAPLAGGGAQLTVGAASTAVPSLPANRDLVLELARFAAPTAVRVGGEPLPDRQWMFDADAGTTTVWLAALPRAQAVTIDVEPAHP